MIQTSDFLLSLSNNLTNSTEWIAIASLKTIPLIGLVLIVQRLFRKQLSAASRHLLWLSVLLSLSIPFGWTLNIDHFTVHNSANNVLSSEQNPKQFSSDSLIARNAQKIAASNENFVQNISALQSQTSVEHTLINFISKHYVIALAILWLCGSVIFFGLTLIQARYFYRIKINASPVSTDIFAIFNSCKRELGINKSIQLLSTQTIQSPITVGWLKPAVILPQNIEQHLAPATLKFVLLHELGHIKRQDIVLNWITCLINIVHWFNPAVWFACKRMRMDMEMACDALVINHLDKSQRKNYGATLIEISDIPRTSPKALTTLGILENHTELKERLHMIKDFTTMNIKNSIVFGIILTMTAITSLAQPGNANNDKQIASSEKSTKNTAEKSTDDYIDLKDFAKIAEKEFKIKVLVGQNDAQKIIQVNVGKEPLSYGQFLTQLKINEFTAYKSKDYIQIITMREARNLSIPIVEKGKTYFEDEVVTDYLTTEKACSRQMLATIRPLVPQYSHLSAFDDSRTMVIIDTYGNIQRIKAVIKTLEANLDAPVDCKSPKEPETRPGKNEAK
jgi:bla regulator protein BlaR1